MMNSNGPPPAAHAQQTAVTSLFLPFPFVEAYGQIAAPGHRYSNVPNVWQEDTNCAIRGNHSFTAYVSESQRASRRNSKRVPDFSLDRCIDTWRPIWATAAGTSCESAFEAGPQSQWVALVVEDDDDQRDLIGAILEESDVKVIACDSAEAAMKVMENGRRRCGFRAHRCGSRRQDGRRRSGASNWATAGRIPAWSRLPAAATASGWQSCRSSTRHLEKPWRALDLIIELERAIAAH